MVRRKEEKRRPIIFVSHMGRMETEKGDHLLGEGERYFGWTLEHKTFDGIIAN